jgi:hypothetical protein
VEPAYEPALRIDTWSRWNSSYASPDRDYEKQKSELYLAICAGAIPLFGRPGIGVPRVEDSRDSSFWFDRYGDRELVLISKLHEAGFDQLDFRRSWIGKITEWDKHDWPAKGWGYSDLVVPTAELMRVFPVVEDPFAPVIELSSENATSILTAPLPEPTVLFLRDARDRVAERTGVSLRTAGITLHNALCGRDLKAEAPNGERVPQSLWRSFPPEQFLRNIEIGTTDWGKFEGAEWWINCINPCLRTLDVDLWLIKAVQEAAALERWLAEEDQPVEKCQNDQSAAEKLAPEGVAPVGFGIRESSGRSPCVSDPLPVYLQFLVEMVPLLGGCDRIAERKKADIEVEIEARWRPELGRPSQNLVGGMATILRPPEAQRGGAKPMRMAGIGASREEWNRSTLSDEATPNNEAVEGGTV